MKNFSKGIIILCAVLLVSTFTKAQSVHKNPAVIINDIGTHSRVFSQSNIMGKTATCNTDTVNYTFNKTTAFQALNLTTSASVFAQWYPAPQALTVYGFDFYAWQTAATSAVVSITCNIYNSTVDSLPTGLPLRSVTVNVDSSFGGGLLSVLRKQAIFATPLTTNQPYVLTIETSSSVNVAAVANSWSAAPANGRSQWLSSIKLGSTFVRSYNISIGTSPSIYQFNADFIFQPYVSYSLTSGFNINSRNAGGNTVTFTNTSSPILFNPFYSVRAFQSIPQLSCLWDYGDTTGTWYTVDGTHSYTYRVPHSVKLKDTLYGWMTGCADQTIQTLNAAPAPAPAHNNGPLCIGATLRLTADTIPGANYYWTGPNGFSATTQNPTLTGANISMIGNYNVRAIIGQCSSMVATTYVNVISTPSATNNGPLCAGQTLNLSVTNITGALYSWSGPNGFTSTSQSPSKTGTTIADSGVYTVTVTLAGCGSIPYTTTAVINKVPATPTVTNNGPLCVGDNLNLTATYYSGGTYNWSGPNSFTSTQQNPTRPFAQNTFAGSYTVSITNNGCTSGVGSTTVIINNVPTTPLAGNNGPLCSGQTLSLTASAISGATYSWSGPNGFTSTTQNPTRTSLSTLDAGNYSVIATANGCPSQAGVTYVAITTLTPTPTTGNNGPLCPGQNLQLTASNISGASYSWSGPNGFTSTQQNPTVSSVTASNAGIYSVTANTSGCGTSSSGNTTLTVNALPSAPTAGNNGPICSGDSLHLTASNVAGASYFWSGPSGFSSTQQSPAIPAMNNTKAGLYTVYVTVTGCGTSPTSSTTVQTHAVPSTPTATSSQPCAGDSIVFACTTFGVGPNTTYSWSGPNSFSSTLKNPILYNSTALNAGTYSVIVTDSGCKSQSAPTSVTVKSIPVAPIPSSNAPICEGSTLLLSATAVSGATYIWSGPSSYNSSSQNPIIFSAVSANSGTYTVSSIINKCVSLPASVTVLINPLPTTPTVSNTGPKCVGDNISLSASNVSGATYSWTGPGGYASTLQNPVLTNVTTAVSGIYNVIAISSTCASPSASTTVIVNTFPQAPTLSSYPVSGNGCTGDSMMLFASSVAGATYNWTGPAGFGSTLQNPVIKNLSLVNAGIYSSTITKGGCTSSAQTLSISVNTAPNTGAITGLNAVKNYSTQVYSVSGSPGSVYSWSVTGGTFSAPSSTNSVSIVWGAPSSTASLSVVETAPTGCSGLLKKLDVTITANTGITENIMKNGMVKLYPNPATKVVNVDYDLSQASDSKIDFVNILGQVVLSQTTSLTKKEQTQIDISSLQTGVYFVNITVGDEKKIVKLTID